jgi:hypothetical protein
MPPPTLWGYEWFCVLGERTLARSPIDGVLWPPAALPCCAHPPLLSPAPAQDLLGSVDVQAPRAHCQGDAQPSGACLPSLGHFYAAHQQAPGCAASSATHHSHAFDPAACTTKPTRTPRCSCKPRPSQCLLTSHTEGRPFLSLSPQAITLNTMINVWLEDDVEAEDAPVLSHVTALHGLYCLEAPGGAAAFKRLFPSLRALTLLNPQVCEPCRPPTRRSQPSKVHAIIVMIG